MKREEGGDYTVNTTGGAMVFKTDSEKEALLAVTIAYSVFNISFPRKSKPMLLFVQKVVLKIDDGTKLPSKVVKFCMEQDVQI